MSVETDMFYISVIGPKANVTRMLNEAIRQEGAGELIVDGDDIETINRKITGRDGKPGMMVKFAELIDEKCLEDDALLKERWQARVMEKSDGDFEMDIELAKVVEYDSDSYEVKFSEYVPEWVADFDCIDWAGWEDIARVYKCRVFVDDDEYYNGAFWRFCGATVYEPVKGGVSKKCFEPQLDLEGYKNVYDELIELNPERYRSKKLHDFEDKITRMQNEVYREKINMILSQQREYDPIADPSADPIDIPGDIVRIPSYAFNSSKDIGRAYFHEGTVRIGDNAFLDCYNLIVVDLPSTLREIGSGAFKGCKSLEKIVLPASLESLGREAFKGCNLKSIKVEPGNEYWYSKGNCLIDKKDGTLLLGCKKSVVPEGISSIADGAFWECAGLKSIVIPSGVVRIGNHAFRDCTGLKRVVIPGTVTCISGWSFMGCTSLEEVVIEDGVEIIDVAAFANCTSLKRIVIPPSVKQISAARFASGAFEGCTSLVAVDLPDGVSIDEGAFKGCPCEEEVNKK